MVNEILSILSDIQNSFAEKKELCLYLFKLFSLPFPVRALPDCFGVPEKVLDMETHEYKKN